MAGSRHRNLSSRAIVFSAWEPIAATVRSGRRRAMPGSKGRVFIAFRRDPARYSYWLNRPFPLSDWLNWMKASSVGRRWNARYLGRVG